MRPHQTSSYVCFESIPDVVRSQLRPGTAVCEIGGGANPRLSRADRSRRRLTYTLVDVDPRELAKPPADVCKIELDITLSTLPQSFDVIVTKQLGGVAIHFFPTFYSASFVLTRIIQAGAGAPDRATLPGLLSVWG